MSIVVLVGNLECESDWDLADLMGGPVLSSQTSIPGDYGHLLEACSVVDESVPQSMADLLSLAIRGVEAMTRGHLY